MHITSPIIPTKPQEVQVSDQGELDLKAICIFAAIGFFLDEDTFWTYKKILKPGCTHKIDSDGKLQESKPYFEWHYTPRDISFNEALDEFTMLFETIIKEQTKDKKVILPLSGGLDSRTQAAALKHLKADVFSYSYDFEHGYLETKIASQVAKECGFGYKSFKIKKGYLWNKIDALVLLNNCQSDLTSPRQMAISDEFSKMGDVFSLGHWGDVLFDSYDCDQLTHDQQVNFLSKKLLKRGGLDFATDLWREWNLEGDFESYFLECLSEALNSISIENTNARLRAFKSKFWAPRWTSINLSIFEDAKPITLPYYDNRMCEFICTIPEKYLKDRQLQIAYIKKRNPKLAKLVWQDKRPYNLYNFTSPNSFKTFAYKITNKLSRTALKLAGRLYIQRNWELQFLGNDNRKRLEFVLKDSKLSDIVPEAFYNNYITNFYKKDALKNAHAVNILLVLAKFNQHFNHG